MKYQAYTLVSQKGKAREYGRHGWGEGARDRFTQRMPRKSLLEANAVLRYKERTLSTDRNNSNKASKTNETRTRTHGGPLSRPAGEIREKGSEDTFASKHPGTSKFCFVFFSFVLWLEP